MQVRFLMLNTMCLTSLHNIQQDLINLYRFFSSLLMQMIFFLLLKQTVPNSDARYFRASVICGSFMFLFCLVFAMFCARLFICALWSPAGKGLTSWLSFVVSSVSLSLSHWYPGSGVVLDCIDC